MELESIPPSDHMFYVGFVVFKFFSDFNMIMYLKVFLSRFLVLLN